MKCLEIPFTVLKVIIYTSWPGQYLSSSSLTEFPGFSMEEYNFAALSAI